MWNVGPVESSPFAWSQLYGIQLNRLHFEVLGDFITVHPCHWCHILHQKPEAEQSYITIRINDVIVSRSHLLQQYMTWEFECVERLEKMYQEGLNIFSTWSRSKNSLLRCPCRLWNRSKWACQRSDYETDTNAAWPRSDITIVSAQNLTLEYQPALYTQQREGLSCYFCWLQLSGMTVSCF